MTAIEPYRGDSDRQIVVSQPTRGEAPQKGDNIDISGLLAAFRRHLRLFAIVVGATLALVLLFLLVFPAQFTGTARVTINDRAISTTPQNETPIVAQLPAQSAADVPTEVQVIQSRRVIGQVIDTLHLDKDPEFAGSHLGFTAASVKFINNFFAPVATTSKHDEIINAIAAKLLPVQYLTTNAIDINFTDHDPKKAQLIANAFAQAYLNDQVQAKRNQSTQASAGVLAQIEQMRAQADADSQNVQAYKIAHNLMSVGAQTLTEQEISTYNQQIAGAKADAAADAANLRTAQDQLAHGSNGGDVGATLTSTTISALRAQRAEVSAKLANLEGHYGPKYPDLAQSRQQLQDLDQEIRAEIQRIISNLSAKAAISQTRLETMQATLDETKQTLAGNNSAEAGLENLMRQAEVSQQIYEAYLARAKESIAQASSLIPDAQIVSYSGLPEVPSFPLPMLFLPLGVVAGFLFGCAAVLIAEMTESRLMTAEDVEERLGCPCLGSIPLLASVSNSSASPIDAMVSAPASAYSEAFRALRPAIGYSIHAAAPLYLLVTSALPGEGKTTVAAGLARTSALQGVRTVLVDCDALGQGLTRALRLDGRPGLLEVLAGTTTIAEALVDDEASGAKVLPIGIGQHSSNEMLAGEAMDKLLATLRQQASIIVIDAPPVLSVAATRVLAAKADAVLLVTQWRKTSDSAVRAALRLLPTEYVQLAGVVLDRVDVREIKKYGKAEAGRFGHYKMHYA